MNIEDCIRVGFKNLTMVTPTGRNTAGTISNDKQTFTGYSSSGCFLNNLCSAITGDYEVSFKVASANTPYGAGLRIGLQSEDKCNTGAICESYCYCIECEGGSRYFDFSETGMQKTRDNWEINDIITFTITGTTVVAKRNGTTVYTKTGSWLHDNLRCQVHGWGNNMNNYIGITDFKIKPL